MFLKLDITLLYFIIKTGATFLQALNYLGAVVAASVKHKYNQDVFL